MKINTIMCILSISLYNLEVTIQKKQCELHTCKQTLHGNPQVKIGLHMHWACAPLLHVHIYSFRFGPRQSLCMHTKARNQSNIAY